MTEIKGNIWNYRGPNSWTVITTNGFVKNNGCAVMGRGVALQAASKFPEMPKVLGERIKTGGNHVHFFSQQRLIAFPVKHNWFDRADLDLIQCSLFELTESLAKSQSKVYMPRPGCGNGQLSWSEVKPLLASLDDRFTVVDLVG